MKLSITDKFLWQLYDFIEKLDDAHHFLSSPRTMPEVVYPEMAKLRREYQKQKARRNFSQFINYLSEQGYIRIKSLEATKGIILTRKGAKKALRAKRRTKEKQKRKDGHWVMIIFDIPENKRSLRDFLRSALIELGYMPLQKSVWVCPYDVYQETEEAIKTYKVIRYVKLFLIKEVELT